MLMLRYYRVDSLKYSALIYEQNVPLALISEDNYICCGRLTALVRAFRDDNGDMTVEFGFTDDDDWEQFQYFQCKDDEELQRVFHEVVRITKDFCSFYKVDYVHDWYTKWISIVDSTIGRKSEVAF